MRDNSCKTCCHPEADEKFYLEVVFYIYTKNGVVHAKGR